MSDHKHHEHLLKELEEQLKPLFENSPQGIYVYLDDTHKTCNKKFADMLGYGSVQEWIASEYPIEDVKEDKRDKVIDAYIQASEHLTASTLDATWTTKKGENIKTEVTMVPFPYKDEIFVLHYISEKK